MPAQRLTLRPEGQEVCCRVVLSARRAKWKIREVASEAVGCGDRRRNTQERAELEGDPSGGDLRGSCPHLRGQASCPPPGVPLVLSLIPVYHEGVFVKQIEYWL